MTTGTVDNPLENQDEELTPEQEAAADAEFEAAFNAARGDEPGAESTTSKNDANADADKTGTDQDDDAKAEAEAAAKAAAEAEAAANAPVTITKADYDRLMTIANEVPNLREQLTKTHDTVAGRIGSLQQTINALKSKAEGGNRASIKQLKRLESEFPELANLLREDLSEAFGGASDATDTDEGKGKDQQQTDAKAAAPTGADTVDPRVEEAEERARLAEMKVVDVKHPGWREFIRTDDFKAWKSTLPPVAIDLLESTWNADVMTDAFNDFKKWSEQRQAARTTKQQSDKRLEHAMTPTDGSGATGAHVVDDDAAFEAGFKKVRGGR
jgi:hypothetical protein